MKLPKTFGQEELRFICSAGSKIIKITMIKRESESKNQPMMFMVLKRLLVDNSKYYDAGLLFRNVEKAKQAAAEVK